MSEVCRSVDPKLVDLLCEMFSCDAEQIAPETSATEIDGWDSLSHTILLLRIEKTFAIRLDKRKFFDLRDIGQLDEMIKSS